LHGFFVDALTISMRQAFLTGRQPRTLQTIWSEPLAADCAGLSERLAVYAIDAR